MISKQSLIAYGEQLADRSSEISEDFSAGFYDGFSTALELMWPLVEALEFYSSDSRRGTLYDLGEQARQALSDLEKRIGAE